MDEAIAVIVYNIINNKYYIILLYIIILYIIIYIK